ncbi:MAG: tRNA (guanosine(46)-N7)-methyltransferase TrmB [Chloroflexota bacterium]
MLTEPDPPMTLQHRKLSTLNMPWPPDWDAVFGTAGQNRPLIVEIGFGYGHMLFHLADSFPDANIIGVELGHKPLEAVEKRIVSRGYHNIRVLYGYAETFLAHMLRPASVEQIHVNFPDPWFKSGHSHRRLIKRPTVDAIASRLVPGGMFYLATDIDAYAEMSHEVLANTPSLTNQFETAWSATIDNRVTTKYEGKALEAGRTNKYFAYQRNDHPAPDVPLLTEPDMPNLVFKTSLTTSEIATQFEPHKQSFPDEDIHVSVMSVFTGSHGLLFEVFAKEPTIEQHTGFLLVEKQDKPGEFTLRLGSFGHPRATDGIHRAAVVIENVVKQMAPDYEIVHRKIRE